MITGRNGTEGGGIIYIGLIRAVYRERRRLTLVLVLSFLSGTLFYSHIDAVVRGLPAPVFMGALYAGIITPVAVAVCLFLPTLRFMIEAMSIARFAVASVAAGVPGLAEALAASPFMTANVVILTGLLLMRLLHGRIVRTPPPSLVARFAHTTDCHRPPARVVSRAWQRRFTHWIDDAEPVRA